MAEDSIKKILEKLKELAESVKSQGDRLNVIEDRTVKPTYEYRSSLAKPQQSHKSPQESPTQKKKSRSLENFFAHYALPGVAIAVFIIGMVFLVSYTIKHEFISPLWRVLLGAITAAVFLGVGQFLSKRSKSWARLLLAGGITLLYAVAYVAFGLYAFLPPEFGFLAFVVITACAMAFALLHGSITLANLSLLGAFSMPLFLAQQGLGIAVLSMAAYLLVVAVGFTLMSDLKGWPELLVVSFIGLIAYYVYFLAGVLPETYALFYLASILVLYTVIPLCYAILSKKNSAWPSVLVSSSAGLIIYWMVYQLMAQPTSLATVASPFSRFVFIPQHSFIFVVSVVGFILFYLFAYLFVFCINRQNKGLVHSLIATASLLIVLAVVVTCSYFNQVSVFSVCALFFFGWGVYFNAKITRIIGYVFWVIAGFCLLQGRMMSVWKSHYNYSLETTAIIILLMTLLIACYAAYGYSFNKKSPLRALLIGALLLPAYWVLTVGLSFAPWNSMPLIIYSFGLLFLGMLCQISAIRSCAYWLIGIAIGFFIFRYGYDNLIHPQWYAARNTIFLGFSLFYLLSLWLMDRFQFDPHEKTSLRSALYFLLTWTVFIWGITLILTYCCTRINQTAFFMRLFTEASPKNEKLVTTYSTDLALAVYYSIAAVAMMSIGSIKKERLVRYSGFFVLAVLLYKIFFEMLHAAGTVSKIISFLGIGIVLLLGSWLYQRLEKRYSKKNSSLE